jgi:hypothetical protein
LREGLTQAIWTVHIAPAARLCHGRTKLVAIFYTSLKGDADMDISVEIHCETCGSANYSLPRGSEEDAPIVCNDCGADQGSFGALKAALTTQAIDLSAESLRRNLERLRGSASEA